MSVGCIMNGMQTRYPTEEAAVHAWNTRPTPEPLQMREAFEKWYNSIGEDDVQTYFDIWQAAWSARATGKG